MDWNDLLKTLAPTVVGFGLGTWNTSWVQRKADVKAARSTLRAQGQELAAALAAMRVERNVHKENYYSPRRKAQALGMSFMAWSEALWKAPAEQSFSERSARSMPAAVAALAAWRDKADQDERRVVETLHHLFVAALPLAGSSHAAVAAATREFLDAVTAEEPDEAVDKLFAAVMAAIRQANAKPLRWWQWRNKRRQRRAVIGS